MKTDQSMQWAAAGNKKAFPISFSIRVFKFLSK